VAYLFAAYAVIWTALFLYLSSLHRRQDRLARELENLRAALGQDGPGEGRA
jgi:CcmD family protein